MTTAAQAARPPAELWDGLRRLATLPGWLEAAVDGDRVRAALAGRVAEFASGRLRLLDCEPKRLRLEGGHWAGFYRLTVAGPEPGTRLVTLAATIAPPGVTTAAADPPDVPFGAQAWRRTLPELGIELRTEPPDATLTALPQLTDPERASALLEAGLRASSPAYADFRIAACRPRVVRYKPGSRCTILYDLDYPPEAADRGWPGTVFAKTYEGDKGANAYRGMLALWHTDLSSGEVVTIAEPLAYIPEHKVLLQRSIPEQRTLKQLLRSALEDGTDGALAELDARLAQTAAGLAALHACGVRHGVTATIAGELAEIRAAAAALAGPLPGIDQAAAPLLDWVEELAGRHPADPSVPTHRSFRPAQVLLAQDRIGFIDFDGICQAEPALDVALFRASLKDLVMDDLIDRGVGFDRPAYLATLAQLERRCDVFTGAYAARGSVSPARVMLWETLDLLTNVLNSVAKLKPAQLPTTMLLLERHLWPEGPRTA